MTDLERTAGELLVAGSLIFGFGASIGVPRVFTETDRQTRLRMLEERAAVWRFAQPLYAGGPVLAAVGVGVLARSAPSGPGQDLFVAAAVALVIGSCLWAYSCMLRGLHIADFALGRLPGWPFAGYALLTISGLALLGSGLLNAGYPDWLGWLVLGSDVLFLGFYLRTSDLPPFVFYLLLLLVGVVVLGG